MTSYTYKNANNNIIIHTNVCQNCEILNARITCLEYDNDDLKHENLELKELWPNAPHTQALKKLFLTNQDKIKPIDIRPFLIPFSLELLELKDMQNLETIPNFNIKLYDYLKDIDLFFCLKHPFVSKNLQIYGSKLYNLTCGQHYLDIKKKYYKFLCIYKNLLNMPIGKIYINQKTLFEYLSLLLNDIMEWYICASIINCNLYNNESNKQLPSKHSHILHTGLYHAHNIVELLIKYYNYEIIIEYGNTKYIENNIAFKNGCIELDKITNILFDDKI